MIPEEDVMGMKDDDNDINKRYDNNSNPDVDPKTDEQNEQVQFIKTLFSVISIDTICT